MGWKYTYAYLVPDEPFELSDLVGEKFFDLTRVAREWAVWDKAHSDRLSEFLDTHKEDPADDYMKMLGKKPEDEVVALYGKEHHVQELGLFLLVFREFRGHLTMWGTAMRAWGKESMYALGALHAVGFRGEVWRVSGHHGSGEVGFSKVRYIDGEPPMEKIGEPMESGEGEYESFLCVNPPLWDIHEALMERLFLPPPVYVLGQPMNDEWKRVLNA